MKHLVPPHLTEVGRKAFDHYIELLPDYPDLAGMLAEVEQLQHQVFTQMSDPTPAQQRLYMQLVSKRVELLSAAGLTPKAAKWIHGSTGDDDDTDKKQDLKSAKEFLAS